MTLELDTERCCHAYFEMDLIEAVHISPTLNRQLNREQRTAAMERAGETSWLIKKMQHTEGGSPGEAAPHFLHPAPLLSAPGG